MSKARDASFRQLVRQALHRTIDRETPLVVGGPLATKVAETVLALLHERGLAIHDPVNCVRVPWQERGEPEPMGRPMTTDEMVAVGLVMPADDVPDDA